MSKRIANCNGRSTARFGRIRIGWRKARMLSQLDKIAEADALGKLDSDQKANFEDFKTKVKAVIPKNILRRHQAR